VHAAREENQRGGTREKVPEAGKQGVFLLERKVDKKNLLQSSEARNRKSNHVGEVDRAR